MLSIHFVFHLISFIQNEVCIVCVQVKGESNDFTTLLTWLVVTFHHLWAINLPSRFRVMLKNVTGTNKRINMSFIAPSGDFVTWRGPKWWGDIFPLPASLVHCQRKQLTGHSTVRLADTLHAAAAIRGVGNSAVLRVLELRSLYRSSPYKHQPLYLQREC